VALDRSWGAPSVIHDGVSVAKEITLEDKFENMGAQLVKEAASKTNERRRRRYNHRYLYWHIKLRRSCMRYVTAGTNPMIMKRGMDKAVEAVVAEIRSLAKPVVKVRLGKSSFYFSSK
jgi:chaperonin GroEL